MAGKSMKGLVKAGVAVGVLVVVAAVAGIFLASRGRPPMIQSAAPPTAAELAAKAEAMQRARPHTVLHLDGVRGMKGDGNTLMLSGTLTNSAGFDIKDPKIRCLLTGPSLQQVGQLTQTLHETVPAKGGKRFDSLNMGAMGPDEVGGFHCAVTEAAS